MKHKVNIFSHFDLGINIFSDLETELYIDIFPKTEKKTLRILWIVEPEEINHIYSQLFNISPYQFDLILTWDKKILNSFKNSNFFGFGTSWIKNPNLFYDKKYGVTSLIGGKMMSKNHEFRQNLPTLKDYISNIPIEIFNSINTPSKFSNLKKIEDRTYKDEMFYSQFHICIENFSKENFFTEKIIDCFRTKTIPIYMGCPNIGDFFDINGILVFDTFDKLINILQKIDDTTYNNLINSVEKNFILCDKFCNFRENLKQEVINFIDSKHKT